MLRILTDRVQNILRRSAKPPKNKKKAPPPKKRFHDPDEDLPEHTDRIDFSLEALETLIVTASSDQLPLDLEKKLLLKLAQAQRQGLKTLVIKRQGDFFNDIITALDEQTP